MMEAYLIGAFVTAAIVIFFFDGGMHDMSDGMFLFSACVFWPIALALVAWSCLVAVWDTIAEQKP